MQRTPRSRIASASVIMLLLGLFQAVALTAPAEAQIEQHLVDPSCDSRLDQCCNPRRPCPMGAQAEQQLVDPYFGLRGATGFGTAVAVSGNRILIGSSTPGDFGVSYLFEPNEDGTWADVAKLEGGYVLNNRSVALDGDRALTGVPGYYFSRRLPATGAAYVYDRQEDGSWVRSDTLLADDAAQDDSLGVSVSLDGDRALVGAPGNSDGAGAAYVFERQESGSWAQVAKLTPDDADARYHIGWFVSLSGDRALVGCWPTSEGNELVKTCTPYIFERQGDGSWEQTARIVTPDAAEENQYAFSASLEGSRAVVGIAVSPSDNTVPYTSTYVFERVDDGSWAQVQRLVPQSSLGQGEDILILTGWSVDLDGDRVLLGAPASNRDASSSGGAAYLFERRSDGTWAQTNEFMGSESADYLYGWSVALDGDVAVVGTVGFFQNAAYVYTGITGTAAEGERELPEAALLHANYPNPFGPRTTIPFTLPTATHVTINVYDVLGREVATLMDAEQPAGSQQVTWEAANVPSGVYVVRLTAGAATQTRTVVVQK